MFKLIAHRAQLNGPDHDENKPCMVDYCIANYYDVEIDIRVINNNIMLGHDCPKYIVDLEWLINRKDFLWCHAKNPSTLGWLMEMAPSLNVFHHDKDECSLTSHGYIWSYKSIPNHKSIWVMPEHYSWEVPTGIYGVCTDYVNFIRNKL